MRKADRVLLLAVVSLVALLVLFAIDDGEGPLDGARFTALMKTALHERGFTGTVEFDAAGNSLHFDVDGFAGKMSYGNVLAEYNEAPAAARVEILDRVCQLVMAKVSANIPEKLEAARPHIMPALQSSFYFEQVRLSMLAQPGGQTEIAAASSFADGLDMGLVYDLPASRMVLFESHLAKWDLTVDQAVAIARDNLLRLSGEEFVEVRPGYYEAPWNDSYGATRLILTEKIRNLRVAGSYVAVVPSRDVLAVTGSDDFDGLSRLVALCEACRGKPRPIRSQLYRLDGDVWVPFVPEGPLSVRCQALRTGDMADMYTGQQELVPTILEAEGTPCIMAQVEMARHQATGSLMTFFVWTAEPHRYAPATTHVIFSDPSIGAAQGSGIGPVPWDIVERVLAQRLRKTKFEPSLYELMGFPNTGELERLSAASL